MKVVEDKQIFIVKYTGVVFVENDHRKVCEPSHCEEISCPCNLYTAISLLKCIFTANILSHSRLILYFSFLA